MPWLQMGRCAITIWHGAMFKTLQRYAKNLRSNVDTVMIPGSTTVWDRHSKALLDCDKARCPFAASETTYADAEQLVNRAPFFGAAGQGLALPVAWSSQPAPVRYHGSCSPHLLGKVDASIRGGRRGCIEIGKTGRRLASSWKL
eukprot:361758-Chlamydomonas_euryale.AAC.4